MMTRFGLEGMMSDLLADISLLNLHHRRSTTRRPMLSTTIGIGRSSRWHREVSGSVSLSSLVNWLR
jgi:hypothetical protein